jgi:Na+-transporting NADH:ubiquinone oxidoreductase subunit C
MAAKESPGKTIVVAFVLCLVCSIIVSSAAVFLKPLQEANQEIDVKKNILKVSGLIEDSNIPAEMVEEKFSRVEPMVVNLQTGQENPDIKASSYNQKKAAKDPKTNKFIDPDQDIAKIKARAKNALVYLVKKDGRTDQIILPVHGKGLWSTMYGFLALDSDGRTVRGITFYQHGETPGLGGEIDNPRWKSQWPGKKVYNEGGEVALGLIKGSVDKSNPKSKYQIDGLSGATLTSNGVTNMVEYWLGKNGFKEFINNFKNGEV